MWLGRPLALDDPPLDMDLVPLVVGSWQGEEVGPLDEELAVLPKDVTIWRRIYRKTEIEIPVEVAVIMSGQRTKASLHDPKICLQAQGWEPIDRDIFSLFIQGYSNNPLKVVRLVSDRKGNRAVSLYWFQSDLRVSSERLSSFWSNARRKLFEGKRERWALIRITFPQVENAEKDSVELLQLLGPPILERWIQ